VQIFADAESLFRDDFSALTAVDIPIGLPAAEPRACDLEARRLLQRRASSVFPAPVRAALAAESYQTACDASERRCGKRLSKQTYAILPKIRDVDAVLRHSPALKETVREVHPEVSFYFWNGEQPMEHPKHSGLGFAERLGLVEEVFGEVTEPIRQRFPRSAVADDDILDALAALWTARRLYAGTAARLGTGERDERGLPMQILA